uniref:Oligosaccharyltransferase complex subunit n=1 Tax=Saimiri boliviensis boliviensis TaxID=39432 RepID=A0A2K6UNK7_SAIBB
YCILFLVLKCPNLKLKKSPWLHMPSAMTVYALVVVSYFLITGGIIYDVIVEPPSIDSMTGEHGHQRPVAFLAYRGPLCSAGIGHEAGATSWDHIVKIFVY